MRLSNRRKLPILGFTLIELMLVLVIAGMMSALVGGLVIGTVAKQERLVEVERVLQTFRMLSYKAYYSGENIAVTLSNNQLLIKYQNKTKTITFKQLDFEEEEFVISTKATVNPTVFSTKWSGEQKSFVIPSLFVEFEG